jgi:hypothetical protein
MPRPVWVRVKDPVTKHEFDRREDDPAVVSGRFERVKRKAYPPAHQPRRPKHFKNLAGLSASRESARPEPETTEATEKENPDG